LGSFPLSLRREGFEWSKIGKVPNLREIGEEGEKVLPTLRNFQQDLKERGKLSNLSGDTFSKLEG
jgi:hypothetical protein